MKVRRLLKSIFDVCFAIVISILSAPIMLSSILLIKIASPEGSVIFKQERIGYRCKPFIIFKLRTMTNETDEYGRLLNDEVRLKRWGKIIRKLSLDELTQILNIFAGQMSWIGPRPLLAHEMEVMTVEEQKERQSVLPGITGWEAVNEEKSDDRHVMAEYDLYYVRNWSIKLDIIIFIRTIMKLIKADRPDERYRAPKF